MSVRLYIVRAVRVELFTVQVEVLYQVGLPLSITAVLNKGRGKSGSGVNYDPLKFEIGVKKLIPRLCRTGDFSH